MADGEWRVGGKWLREVVAGSRVVSDALFLTVVKPQTGLPVAHTSQIPRRDGSKSSHSQVKVKAKSNIRVCVAVESPVPIQCGHGDLELECKKKRCGK